MWGGAFWRVEERGRMGEGDEGGWRWKRDE